VPGKPANFLTEPERTAALPRSMTHFLPPGETVLFPGDGVIFDLDGLLLDPEVISRAAWQRAAHEAGFELGANFSKP
jgi:hypothetical protein